MSALAMSSSAASVRTSPAVGRSWTSPIPAPVAPPTRTSATTSSHTRAIAAQPSQPGVRSRRRRRAVAAAARGAVPVHQAAAARVVVGGDDEADAGISVGSWPSARRRRNDVLARPLGRQAAAERTAEQCVGDERQKRDEDEDPADPRRGDRQQTAHQPDPDMPRMSERRVRPAPERFDPRVPAAVRGQARHAASWPRDARCPTLPARRSNAARPRIVSTAPMRGGMIASAASRTASVGAFR